MTKMEAWTEAVREYLLDLQDRICAAVEEEDGVARFAEQRLEGERGGFARPRVIEGPNVIEKAAVHFSHTRGPCLPPAATAKRPELAGRSFEALSVSLIMHPHNPFAPTSHANVRFFVASKPGEEPVWWFGGGFDLTPYYGFDEDCVHWHERARAACEPFGPHVHPRLKAWCDEYFYLKHRAEPRGIGGLFFDDWNQDGFERSFALLRSVGDHFLPAYRPLLARRKHTPLFGLQAGGRVESILASLPPRVAWRYDWKPEPGSPEERLLTHTLVPRDWLAGA